jgi:hypothetical protein
LTVAEADNDAVDPENLVFEDPTFEEVLDEGIKRLVARGTWKIWSWPPDGLDFLESEQFRQHVTVSSSYNYRASFVPALLLGADSTFTTVLHQIIHM